MLNNFTKYIVLIFREILFEIYGNTSKEILEFFENKEYYF